MRDSGSNKGQGCDWRVGPLDLVLTLLALVISSMDHSLTSSNPPLAPL